MPKMAARSHPAAALWRLSVVQVCRSQIAMAKSVGGVGGLRDFFEPQQPRDHQLHLFFFRSAIADDRRLDRQWRIFRNRDPEEDAASMATPRTCPSLSADFTFTE